MSWNTEADFVESFLSSVSLINKFSKRHFEVWREVRTGFGRPDIVFIEYTPKVLEARRSKNGIDANLSSRAAYAMSYLSDRRWVTVDSLAKFLNCQGNQILSVIKELHNRELLETKGHLVKARPRREVLAVNRVWVFEAKLSDWREAVQQAERHLWFTKDSYVLMPTMQKRLIESISCECDKRGVGLSFFSDESGFRTVVHPAKTGVNNSPLLWLINEKLVGGCNDEKSFFT